mgnify:CR=1 FL=1
MPLGIFLPTSSAWVGPQRTTRGQSSEISERMTWLMRRSEPFSMPLPTLTKIVPDRTRLLARLAVSRMAKEGVAKTTTSLSLTQDRSLLRCSSLGRGTPFSLGFTPSCCISATASLR